MPAGLKMLSIRLDSTESTRIVSFAVDSSYRKSICAGLQNQFLHPCVLKMPKSKCWKITFLYIQSNKCFFVLFCFVFLFFVVVFFKSLIIWHRRYCLPRVDFRSDYSTLQETIRDESWESSQIVNNLTPQLLPTANREVPQTNRLSVCCLLRFVWLFSWVRIDPFEWSRVVKYFRRIDWSLLSRFKNEEGSCIIISLDLTSGGADRANRVESSSTSDESTQFGCIGHGIVFLFTTAAI